MLCAFLAVSAGGLGCRPQETVAHPQRPVTLAGVPIVRVLLTGSGVEEATIATSDGYELFADDRVISRSVKPLSPVLLTRYDGAWRVNGRAVLADRLVLKCVDGLVQFGQARYRGQLQLYPLEPNRLRVVNAVDMESYLAGVLSKELYPKWSLEAYRAQAVAARSFALFHYHRNGNKRVWDLGDGQASQVYGGYDAETDTAWRGVRSTHGRILAYGSPGREKPFLVQYSAACGGHVNPARVLRPAYDIEPEQGGQVCNDCRQCARYRWPPVRIRKTDLYAALSVSYPRIRKLGGIRRIKVRSKTSWGRYEWLDVFGPSGKRETLRAEDMRLAILFNDVPVQGTLYSMNCTIEDLGDSIQFSNGRGFGHGVGLCQWGAEGKSLRGWTGERILGFYYPGATSVRAY
jgi:stage II sporulation protein D